MEHEPKSKKEPRGVRLSRRYVQMYEIDGLRDLMITFDYCAKYLPNSPEFIESAKDFVLESKRMLLGDVEDE